MSRTFSAKSIQDAARSLVRASNYAIASAKRDIDMFVLQGKNEGSFPIESSRCIVAMHEAQLRRMRRILSELGDCEGLCEEHLEHVHKIVLGWPYLPEEVEPDSHRAERTWTPEHGWKEIRTNA